MVGVVAVVVGVELCPSKPEPVQDKISAKKKKKKKKKKKVRPQQLNQSQNQVQSRNLTNIF